MKQILISIFLMIFSSFSLACAMPISGDKYNALIEITKAETDYHVNEFGYTVKFPSIVEGQKLEFAAFYIASLTDKEFDNHIRIPIDIKKQGKFSVGYVAVMGKLDSNITVSVSWGRGGICPVSAHKTIKHNQSKQ
ncbi:hypothetical protein [Aliikangiella maris]|uniref:Uncharacterized protein n=2 Tax=Aliikangiella maris TaxID=3162458 RepID=A0ABV3MV14_9GAMM